MVIKQQKILTCITLSVLCDLNHKQSGIHKMAKKIKNTAIEVVTITSMLAFVASFLIVPVLTFS